MKAPETRTAIVTGAGSGIGQAIAVVFAQVGIDIALAGRRAEALEETAARIRRIGSDPLALPADVTDRPSVRALTDRTVERFGRIDILVNNAGVNTAKRGLKDISDGDWDRVIQVNLTGAFNAFRAVLPQMEEQGGGVVINISSMAGKRAGVVGGAAYSASKFGMASLTQSINAELRETGIRACCIYPGEVDTPILDVRPVPVSPQQRAAALHAEDVAAAALMVAQLPNRAVVEEITIFPRRVVAT